MRDTSQPATAIASTNFWTAIDQQGEHETLGAALQAYLINALDTGEEENLPREDWLAIEPEYMELVREHCPEVEIAAGWPQP